MVGFDLAALVDREARLVERQTIGVRAAPDRHQHNIGFERFGVAAGRGLECQHGLLALPRGRGDLGLALEFHPLFLEDLVASLRTSPSMPGRIWSSEEHTSE